MQEDKSPGDAATTTSAACFSLNTDQFATRNSVKSPTVRARYCRTGSYFGVCPKKLRNGRLVWPDVQVEAAS